MRITSRGLQAVTVGLVSAVVLAGCSSNSTKPTVLPTLQTTSAQPSTTPSAAPATTSAVPTIAPTTAAVASTATPSTTSKADALAASSRAIEKAVRAYYATVNKAIQNPGALKRMRTLFGPGCGQCVSDASNFAKLQAKRWIVKGGTYQLLTVRGTATDVSSGGATVTFNVLPAAVRDAGGHMVASEDAHTHRAEGLTVAIVGGQWKILGYISFGSTS